MLHFLDKRLFYYFLIITSLCFNLTPRAEYIKQIEVGFDGFAKTQRWSPIRIYCSNRTSQSFEGEFRAYIQEGQKRYVFSSPVSLPSPSQKLITSSIFLGRYPTRNFRWELHSKGKIVEQGKAVLNELSEKDMLILAVNSTVNGIQLLHGRKTGADNTQIHLIPVAAAMTDILPEQGFNYESVNAVLWGDVAPDILRPSQIEALKQWVRTGGILIAWGGGAGYQLKNTWLEEMLPVKLFSQKELHYEKAFTENFMAPITLNKGWVITDASVRTDRSQNNKVLLSEQGTDLIVRGQYGHGWVLYLAFDPTGNPISSWEGNNDFLSYLTHSAHIGRSGNSSTFRPTAASSQSSNHQKLLSNLSERLQRDPILKPPPLRYIGLFLFAYILIVGPINYVILLRKKKLEWTWITIPSIVFLFLGAEYAMGRYMKGTRIVVNSAELILGRSGSTHYFHQSLFGLFVPAKDKYKLEIESPSSRVMPLNLNAYSEDSKKTIFQVKDRVKVSEYPMNMWTMDMFWSDSELTIPEPITCNLRLTNAGIQGQIENNSSMKIKNPYLTYMGSYYELPDIAPMETATVDLKSASSSSDVRLNKSFYDREEVFRQERAKSLFAYFKETYLQRKQANVHLLAWVEPEESYLRIGSKKFEQHREALLCLQSSIKRETNNFSIPKKAAIVNWVSDNVRHYDWDPNSAAFNSGAAIAELYPPLPQTGISEVQKFLLNINLNHSSNEKLSIEIFDWAGQNWISLLESDDMNFINDTFRNFKVHELMNTVPIVRYFHPSTSTVKIRIRICEVEEEDKKKKSGRSSYYRYGGDIVIKSIDMRLKGKLKD